MKKHFTIKPMLVKNVIIHIKDHFTITEGQFC